MPANTYSPAWFEVFLRPIGQEQTAMEVDFIARQLPLPAFRSVLDLCCGEGRHARLLAGRGYRVTGIDRDADALARARSEATEDRLTYLEGDMRDLAGLSLGPFDAVVNLWQSFGYFDEAANADMLRQMAATLRPGGRVILDLYHRGFFERHEGSRTFERDSLAVTETRRMNGDRLTVRLDYDAGRGTDTFSWQLYVPEEMTILAERCGLTLRLACAGFDERTLPSPDVPRMQLVFEKTVDMSKR